jgi:hypothetical protein
MECTDIFWHEFYRSAGITLGLLPPLILGFGAILLALFRQLHRHEEALQEARLRHEEAMQEARIREDQGRESRYRVIQGGQG